VIAIVVIVSAILPLITRPPKEEKRVANVSVQAA